VEESTIRVLVVDDYQPWRDSTRSMLEDDSRLRVVGEAADGLEAVWKVRELQVDLVLLDIGLPTLNGIEVAKRIRKLSPQTKILFVSQESSPAVVEQAVSLSEGYVVKRDAGRELRAAVTAVVRGERFVDSRFGNHGLEETPESPVLESVGIKSVSAPLRQHKEIPHRHEVVFYSDEGYFLDSLALFVERALHAGSSAIVVANESHRNSVLSRLQAKGLDIAAAAEQGRYTALDAAHTISTFMVPGTLDPARLLQGLGSLLLTAAKAAKGEKPRVAACGQIAPLLWAQGDAEAAIQIEKHSNTLVETHGVDILCGYPLDSFHSDMGRDMFQRICAEHSAIHSR
jgi:DNA-binding NarL/FixJ family response regulator